MLSPKLCRSPGKEEIHGNPRNPLLNDYEIQMGDKVNAIRVDCISAYASQNIMNVITKWMEDKDRSVEKEKE